MANPSFQWSCKKFDEFTPAELYTLLRLRSEVFVVEQNCVYLDLDNKDQQCYHLTCWDGANLVAAARLVPPTVAFDETSIGRVVNSPAYRNTGAGKMLMHKAIELCVELFGNNPIKIGAQLYLKKFYGTLGFIQIGDVYDEDGIEHIPMLLEQPIL